MRSSVQGVRALVTSLLVLGSFAGLGTSAADAAPAQAPGCAWPLQVSPDRFNVAYPDSGATYWASLQPVPAGGHLEIHGDFPHARYMSVTTYSASTQAIDGLNDVAIEPDDGSINPFLVGADRNAVDRAFTVNVVDGGSDSRPVNTLYTRSADGTKTSPPGSALVVIRIYLPDDGTTITGNVDLPTITSVDADGRRASTPPCAYSESTTVTASALPGIDPPIGGLFGLEPPQWRKFVNLPSSIARIVFDNEITGTTIYPVLRQFAESGAGTGGFFENPDNKYITTSYDRGFGDVLELRGHAPTTPYTLSGDSSMTEGEVRYWSMCTNNSYTTEVTGCIFDEQVPLDSNGDYHVVVSSPEDKPATATAECGVAWLPATPLPQTLLILRNMLPADSFESSIQGAEAGSEEADLGDFYPRGTYFGTASDYDEKGCDQHA